MGTITRKTILIYSPSVKFPFHANNNLKKDCFLKIMAFLTFLFLMGNNFMGQRFSRIEKNPICIIFDRDSEIPTYFSLFFYRVPSIGC